MYDSSTEMCDNYYFCINFQLVFFLYLYDDIMYYVISKQSTLYLHVTVNL